MSVSSVEVFLPVHSVLVSTLVQKILVDHAVGRMIGVDPAWGYSECASERSKAIEIEERSKKNG